MLWYVTLPVMFLGFFSNVLYYLAFDFPFSPVVAY